MQTKLRNILLVLLLTTTNACANTEPKTPSKTESQKLNVPKVFNYQSCVAAGYVVTRSLPEKCIAPDGKFFVNEKARELIKGNGLEDVPESSEKPCKDLCGDGICQEIVCMAVGCPCAETRESCGGDCG